MTNEALEQIYKSMRYAASRNDQASYTRLKEMAQAERVRRYREKVRQARLQAEFDLRKEAS